MNDLKQRFERLSPKQRELFLKALDKKSGRRAVGTRRAAGTRPAPAATPVLRIPRRDPGVPPALSYGQQRLWFLDRFNPGSSVYNLYGAFEIDGPIEVGILHAAVLEIVRRHEILRTVFAMPPGSEHGPIQVIVPELRLGLPRFDLRRIGAEERRRREVLRLARAIALRPYDLSRGPLVRVALLRIEEARHVVVVAMHHIVMDDWSSNIFIRELVTLYTAFRLGRPSPLPALRVQYADFAVWQHGRLRGERLTQLLDFWRRRLEGAPRVLELPTDRQRPAAQSLRGGWLPLRLSRQLQDELATLSQRRHSTLFMTLLAAWQALLSRMSGQHDVVVGSPIAGHSQLELEGTIGFLVNMLALRTDLSGDPSFTELLDRVGETVRSAFAHQEAPFEKLVDELKPERDPSHTPLFQVVFNLLSTSDEDGRRSASLLRVKPVELEIPAAMFDLILTLQSTPEGLLGRIEYDVALFDRSTVRRMAEHLEVLLGGCAADPGCRLAELPLLSAAERAQLIHAWNDTAGRFPDHLGIHDLVAAAARERPDATAVVFGEIHLTRRELDRRAARLARHLRALGLVLGERVAVLLDRSPEMVTALLGCLEAGGVYVPLETRSPVARMSRILETSSVRFLLLGRSRLETFRELQGRVETLRHAICLDAVDLAEHPDTPPECPASAEDFAYVIFTSGSTGTPKGVMVRHRPVVNLIDWLNRRFAFGTGDRVLFITSLGFDLSVYDVFGILAAGGTIRVASDEEVADPRALAEILAREPITFWDSAPAALQVVVPFLPEAVARHGPPALRRVFLSGDWIPLALPREIRRSCPRARVIALGGATEATVWSNFFPVGELDPHWVSIPYGRPIRNARYYVLESRLQPAPIGVPGDLYIGGECLASGYAEAPRLTARQFLPDPWTDVAGAVMYRTGDRARCFADGTIEFLGRLDHQVKIRGFRIELGEIESVLSRHGAVREAVVLVRRDGDRGQRLVAYVIRDAEENPDKDDLSAWLREHLPEYMVPSAWVFLESLPVTANGKLDRRALPAPEPLAESGGTAPRTPAEKAIAGIWSEVLGIETLTTNHNFFELGGDSILSIRIVARAAELGWRIHPRQIFEHPTVAGLAAVAQPVTEDTAEPSADATPVSRFPLAGLDPETLERVLRAVGEPIEDLYPMSPLQQGMLFHTLHSPDSGMYVEQVHFRMRRVDPAAFEHGWQRLVDRHPILRTSFLWSELERPLQAVHPRIGVPPEGDNGGVPPEGDNGGVPWQRIDATRWPAASREKRLAEFLEEDQKRPFDFSTPPLMRLSLIRLAEDTWHFVWSRHNILLDGWSSAVLFNEFFTLYDAELRGADPGLEEPPQPYRDYVAWLEGQDLEDAESFWRRRLADFSAPTPLGLDRPAPSHVDGGKLPGSHTLRLPAAAADALGALARSHQLTLNTLVQGVWALLLGRYSGGDDVLFGTVASGRSAPLADIERMVGLFLNTVPARVRIAPRERLRDWLGKVQEEQSQALRFEFTPLVRLQGWSEVPRGQPLFESLLSFVNYPVDPARQERAGVDLQVEGGDFFEQTHYPFNLLVIPGDGLVLRAVYDTDRFERVCAVRMLDHMRHLLGQLPAHIDAPVGLLPFLGAAERHQLLIEWNDTATGSEEPERCLHELFEVQVERSPDAVAAIFEAERLSYRELDARADRFARSLAARGVGPETVVALLGERHLGFLTAILGIFKAGAAYLPLDPAHPGERHRQVVVRSRTTLILAEEPFAGPLSEALEEIAPARRPPVVELSEMTLDARGELPGGFGPDQLAYVIYTSGSTGMPKGAMIVHRGMINHVDAKISDLGLSAADVVAETASQCFDISVWQFLTPLTLGGTVHIAAEDDTHDPERLLEFTERHGISVLETVPSMLRALLELREGSAAPRLPRLRWLMVTGEACGPELVHRWFDLCPGVPVMNAYGPTECSDDVTHFVVREPLASPPPVLPIGRTLRQLRIHVLDRRLRPVFPGVAGELAVGGIGVGRGYLGDPGRTAAVFVPDALGDETGRRLYRTGDLARHLPDSTLEFLGRIDHQVKVRGFRIELGEIEAVLARHEAVRDAVVLARDEGTGGRHLVAYVVTRGEGAFWEALRDDLKNHLPEYMVPAFWVSMEMMPLLPSGKVNRRALPAPDSEAVQGESQFLAPRTPFEELVAAAFTDVLKIERVGVHSDFFNLGGHSLLATQLVSRIRHGLGVELSLRSVFETPTVAGLARSVREQQGEAERLPPIEPVSRDEPPLPLSFAQQRMWFLHRLEPDSTAYHLQLTLRVIGRLDVVALAATFTEIVRRHEVLRTRFSERSDESVQVIAPPREWELPVVNLGAVPAAVREREALRRIHAVAARAFDLERGPIFRVTLVALGPAEHALSLTLHHIAGDLWSMGVMMQELGQLYAAFSARRPSPLPERDVQYADYACWQRQWLSGEKLETELAYWREQLGFADSGTGPPILDLPTDGPRPPVRSFRGAEYAFELPDDLGDALRRVSRERGATLYMTLLATFQLLLARYTGNSDVSVGSPIAGRNHVQTEGMIGFFVNTLVLRTHLDPNPGFASLLARVREAALRAYTHQNIPFEQLVSELRPKRDLSRTPLFQVMFALQNAQIGEVLEIRGLRFEHYPTQGVAAKFDLTLTLQESGERLVGTAEYSCDLFEPTTVRRLVRHYGNLLRDIVTDSDRPISNLSFLSPGERAQVIREWNDTAVADMDAGNLLHALVEAQVARTPDAVAVVFEGDHRSYAELDSRANQLGRHLRRLGAGPDVPVGILMERCPELVAGLLGILKAGGTYVPLDPSYPRERLAFMAHDALGLLAMPIVLTRESLGDLALSLAGEDRAMRVVCVDADWETITSEGPEMPPAALSPENLAYTIYTSGSTGRPKGATNTHRAICNRISWMQGTYSLSHADRVLQKTPMSFDVSVWEFFWPLMTGAQMVLAVPEGHKDSAYLVRLIAERRVTILHFVPSMLAVFLEEPKLADCGALRQVIASGEALSDELWRRLSGRLPATALDNLYGPTEAAVDVTAHACRPGDDEPTVALGRPIANLAIHLADARLSPVPTGVAGELLIAGTGLARGYWNRPALTAEKFVPHAWGPAPGTRLYRTGDLARFAYDGTIRFLGRIDHQVKIRGFRIELGEVEAVLARHPRVREAVAVVGTVAGNGRLAAWLVATGGGPPPVGELRDFLRSSLPEHMVPSVFTVLEELPTTPSGKVDRRALPAPRWGASASDAGSSEPLGPVGEILAGIAAELLHVDRVGGGDDFFQLGGHSLLAMRLVARVRDVLDVELPLREIFAAPRLADLAQRVAALTDSGSGDDQPILRAVPRDRPLPLSLGQQRLWFLAQLRPGSAEYNMPMAVNLDGPIDLAALTASLGEIVRRHEVFRTSFHSVDGEPVQVIASERRVTLPMVDLRALPETRREPWRRHVVDAVMKRPLDLTRSLLAHWTLLRLADEEHIFVLVVHHIISDVRSTQLLVRELTVLYDAFSRKQASPLPELEIQYADYADWQRRCLTDEVLESGLAYWREQLAGRPAALEVPADHPRPAVRTWQGRQLSFTLPADLVETIHALSHREGLTVFMTLLAAFNVLIARHTKSDDVVLGADLSQREHTLAEGLIGFFINMLVLRNRLPGHLSVRELLHRVREVVLGALAHRHVPYDKLVEELRPRGGAAELFQVVFNYNRNPPVEATPSTATDSELRVYPHQTESILIRFDLMIVLIEDESGLNGSWVYSTELFNPSTIERLHRHFENLLRKMLAHPETTLRELEMYSEEERARQAVEQKTRARANVTKLLGVKPKAVRI